MSMEEGLVRVAVIGAVSPSNYHLSAHCILLLVSCHVI